MTCFHDQIPYGITVKVCKIIGSVVILEINGNKIRMTEFEELKGFSLK